MFRVPRATAVLIAIAIAAGPFTAPSAGAAETDDITVAEFADSLQEAAQTDPVASDSAAAFDELSTTEQETVVDIVNDPEYAQEFLDFAFSTRVASGADITEESELYPAEVQFDSETVTAPLVGATVTSGLGGGRVVAYPANTTQTLRASASSTILGVTITRLNIWITFRTGTSGVPKSVLSSGSSATNFNVIIVLTSKDLTPYISQGIAVARTVWTGSALIQGGAIRIDKLQTLKAYNNGLYSHTLVNQ